MVPGPSGELQLKVGFMPICTISFNRSKHTVTPRCLTNANTIMACRDSVWIQFCIFDTLFNTVCKIINSCVLLYILSEQVVKPKSDSVLQNSQSNLFEVSCPQ